MIGRGHRNLIACVLICLLFNFLTFSAKSEESDSDRSRDLDSYLHYSKEEIEILRDQARKHVPYVGKCEGCKTAASTETDGLVVYYGKIFKAPWEVQYDESKSLILKSISIKEYSEGFKKEIADAYAKGKEPVFQSCYDHKTPDGYIHIRLQSDYRFTSTILLWNSEDHKIFEKCQKIRNNPQNVAKKLFVGELNSWLYPAQYKNTYKISYSDSVYSISFSSQQCHHYLSSLYSETNMKDFNTILNDLNISCSSKYLNGNQLLFTALNH